jgi:hypothetical protein
MFVQCVLFNVCDDGRVDVHVVLKLGFLTCIPSLSLSVLSVLSSP